MNPKRGAESAGTLDIANVIASTNIFELVQIHVCKLSLVVLERIDNCTNTIFDVRPHAGVEINPPRNFCFHQKLGIKQRIVRSGGRN